MPSSLYRSIYAGAGGGGTSVHSSLTNLQWSVAGHTIDANLVPDASGSRDIGTVALAFDDAHINKVYLEGNPTSGLQAVTKNYADSLIAGGGDHATMANLNWAAANHTIDADIDPTASGTINLGSPALAYNDAHIDKVYLEGDPSTGFEATTKDYVDAQIAGITESDTLEIVTGRGATTSNVITPNASGAVDLGTVILAFNDAYIDRVNLEGDPTTGLEATTKNYVDAQDAAADAHITSDGSSHSDVGLNNTHRTSDGTDHSYIDQDVTSGSAPTFTADNLSDGGSNAIVTTTQETNWDNHIADNSQAHSDYLLNTGDTTAGDITPSASGTINIGTRAVAFAEGVFDNIICDTIYGDGSNLTGIAGGGGSSDHATLSNLNWAAAAHTIDADLIATASGTIDVGSAALPFAEVRANDIYCNDIYVEGESLHVGAHEVTDEAGALKVNSKLNTTDVMQQGGMQVIRNNETLDSMTGGLTVGNTGYSLSHSTGPEGWYNTCVGLNAGKAITTGSNNTVLGWSALLQSTTGKKNTSLGMYSMYSNSSGEENHAGCYAALFANTTGKGNCGIGYSAMYSNTEGDYNVGVGYNALYSSTTTDYNTAVGYWAGRYVAGGGENQTPSNSVFLGYDTRSESTGETNQVVIGSQAIGNGANTVTLGNTSISELHCQVDITVDSDARIKRDITPTIVGLDFIEALNPVTFKKVNPADYPDEIKPQEFKDENITVKEPGEDDVIALRKAKDRPKDDDKTYIGLIAQELEEVLNSQGIDVDLVKTNKQGKKSITYGNLVAPLIKAVQELSKEVKDLKAKIGE